MSNVQTITPFLWFKNNNAQEAMDYYLSIFPNSRIVETQYYPDESKDPHLQNMQGKILTAVFELNGQQFMCLDGGDQGWDFNNAVSFLVECGDQAEIDHYWEKLSAVPQDEQCGWCTDKFGVRWQIVPKNIGALMQNPAAVNVMMQQKKIVIKDLQEAK